MKTYFKSIIGDLYLMIDDVKLQVVTTHSDNFVKGLDIIKTSSAYTRYTNESTDTSKWTPSDETSFNDCASQVISGY